MNPERASRALNKLIEEMFPETAKERERAVEKAMEIMEREKQVVYSVAPVGSSLKDTPFGRIQGILKGKRRRKGR